MWLQVKRNTSTIHSHSHLQWHHPNVSISRTRQTGRRVLLPTAFRQPLTADSDQSNNWCYRVFMAADMWPYLAVENTGFKHMVKVLKPRYNVTLRVHVSQSCVALYKPAWAAGQSLVMEHYWYLCYLFFLIDSLPVSEGLNSKNYGQWAAVECLHFSKYMIKIVLIFSELWPQNQGTYWTENLVYHYIPNRCQVLTKNILNCPSWLECEL